MTHVAIRPGPRGPQIDDQTAAGLVQWCKHFNKVTYFGIAEDQHRSNASSASWVDIAELHLEDRCEVVALPNAYRPLEMLKTYSGVKRVLRAAISQHQHLAFTFGGMFGDWPAVAAYEAISQRRNYAAWIDRVEPLVIQNKMIGAPVSRRVAWAVLRPIVEYSTSKLIKKSAVSLLQGRDTFNYYAPISPDPYCTYDTHTQVSDQISERDLDNKMRRILSGDPIRIIYVGRAAAMKGPLDWIAALKELRNREISFRATWIGDGPDLPRMKEMIKSAQLEDMVRLTGYESDRERIFDAMRESDVFLFCHKTLESPRCLIEALVSGCALIGYETAYSKGLVESNGGASLVERDNIHQIADVIQRLHGDRQSFADLVERAARSGELYNEDSLYGYRAQLMMKT